MAAFDFDGIGKGFVQQYYQIFASNRAACAGIYRPNSLMTWSGKSMQGGAAIMEKFGTLTFQPGTAFNPREIECHPTPGNGVLVVVNGELAQPDEAHQLSFNDVFHLCTDQAGQWYVANQLFKVLGGGGHA